MLSTALPPESGSLPQPATEPQDQPEIPEQKHICIIGNSSLKPPFLQAERMESLKRLLVSCLPSIKIDLIEHPPSYDFLYSCDGILCLLDLKIPLGMRASLTAMPAEQPTYLSRFIPDPVGFYWLGRLPQSSEYLDNRKVTALLQTQEDSMPSYLKGIIEDNKFRIHRNEGFLVKWASEL